MSGQTNVNTTPGPLPKTSPISNKRGPLKATIPISRVLKHSSNLRNVSSTTPSSPHLRTRYSSDNASGKRSPGSLAYKGKPVQAAEVIRRTASLDAIYLTGQWPKDSLCLHILQIDKTTQTEDGYCSDTRLVHCSSETNEPTDKLEFRGSRLTSPGDHTLNSSPQTLASCVLSSTLKMNPASLKPLPSKCSMRSSIEGLNQEIERIVLRNCDRPSSDRPDICYPTPEGHRAPLAEILKYTRSRSVNTQTPQDFAGSCPSSDGSSPESEMVKFSTSPHINKFLAREPPDGCERVRLKTVDEKTNIQMEHTQAPPSTFKLRPSLGSAFHVLQPDLGDMEKQKIAQSESSATN